MMWSRHSRRIDPINRSAKAFNRLVPYAHGAQSTFDDSAKGAIPIADEVARSLIPGERLCYLTRDPFRCRMSCDPDPDKGSTVEPDNDEGIKSKLIVGTTNKSIAAISGA